MVPINEKDFQQTLIEAARAWGWLVGFTHDSRHSETGEPDLRMVHRHQRRVVFIEVKTDKGRVRKGRWNKKATRWLPGQDEWAETLMCCPGVEYYLWRPTDWPEIELVLGTKRKEVS